MADRLSDRAREIFEAEEAVLIERTPKSRALFQRAERHMPYGVASTFQANDPYPVYVARGMGSHLWDVDGNEYVDFHGGFGCNVVGHAHPKVVAAIEQQSRALLHYCSSDWFIPRYIEVCERLAASAPELIGTIESCWGLGRRALLGLPPLALRKG